MPCHEASSVNRCSGSSRPHHPDSFFFCRAALDVIRRLDEVTKQKRSYRDVFLPDAIHLRNSLQDYCERLMFYDPIEYGRKAEELLWRKVFYDVIQLMKHNRKQMRPSSSLESAFRTHLMAATGYYNHLLVKLQAEFSVKVEGIIDFHHLPELRTSRRHLLRKTDPDIKVSSWALKACHRCLIYLGDLARYQQDYDETSSRVLSQRYYYQALALCPSAGMPFNQLGTLAGTRFYNLDSAYFYLRCLSSPSSFEGAQGNLTRLLEKNARRFTELTQTSQKDLPPNQQRGKDIKRFIVRFMQLLHYFWKKPKHLTPSAIQELCQATLQDFNMCMFYQAPPSLPACRLQYANDDRLLFLPNDLVFKVLVICLISIHHLQKSGTAHVAAAVAFSLALFSHILNHVVIRLQAALYEIENPRKVLTVDTAGEPLHSANDCDLLNSCDLLDEQGSTTTDCDDRRRRRKAGQRSSSSESDDNRPPNDSEGRYSHEVLSEDDSLASEDDLIHFLQTAPSDDSSPSDTDSDNLMVSQELRSGFVAASAPPSVMAPLSEVQEELSPPPPPPPPPPSTSSSSSSAQNALSFGSVRCKTFFEILTKMLTPCNHFRRIAPVVNGYMTTKNLENNSTIATESEFETETDTEVENKFRLERLLGVVMREGLLSSIKVYCDWMQCNSHVIETTAPSCSSLWSRFSVLLNFLPSESDIASAGTICTSDVLLPILRSLSPPHIPLKEDVHLNAFPPLKETHANLNFDMGSRPDLSHQQEAILRVCSLRSFGRFVAEMNAVQFQYDPDKSLFCGPIQSQDADQVVAQQNMADVEARRNQLMKDMAQLRLQAEVSQLEGRLQEKQSSRNGSSGAPNFPPYLVPDAVTICENLAQIKQLTNCARFILIIPIAVIDHLDILKKDKVGAREGIRWLEAEFRKGNRFIRAQKNHEKTSAAPGWNLKKKDRDAWRFAQIVDCGKYFAQQCSDCDANNMVGFLTNISTSEDDPMSAKVKEYLADAHHEGLMVESALEFHSRWKAALQSNN
ncbi:hypothetical protein CAPTEDRAFT_168258 [Capitella teleta]|uniref:PIN domain-containing protein n=1 Tax=Capitella teleta TaxID=283909 RepID=R7T7R5_CAPTE|nr:hypothetical protein CAPTEDRAFT_168258 [Capitella teleta]|eukprot:ELT89650.1 hypothetical protein CAPTEDRAFT_168258 [Capitella teleta]